MKVQVKNHGLIKRAELEFVPGLNLLVGPTSNGKSSLIEGIQSTVFNTPGDQYITSGESVAALRIEYNGHSVIRKRDLNAKEYKTVYGVDGKSYGKIGRASLDQVNEALNIREIKLLDSKLRPNFSEQFDKPFLVKESPPKIFEFITTSDDAVNLSQILHEMRSDLDQSKVEVRVGEATVNALTRSISREKQIVENSKGVQEVMQKVRDIEPDVQKLESLEVSIMEIDYNRVRAIESRERAKAIAPVKEIDDLVIRETLKNLADLADPCSKAYYEQKEMERLKDEILVIGMKLKEAGKVKDPQGLKEMENEVRALTDLVEDADKLMREARRIKEYMDNAARVLKVPMPGEIIDDIKVLLSTIDIAEINDRAKNNILRTMGETEKELNTVEEELSTFKACPLCGAQLSTENHLH